MEEVVGDALEIVRKIETMCEGFEVKGKRIIFKVRNAILEDLLRERFRVDINLLNAKGWEVEFNYPAKDIKIFPETFDNFFYGKENEFAVVALRSLVINRVYYRTAVVFGDAGMGKTHILKALANESIYTNRKPAYVSSNKILSELIEAYRSRKKETFAFLKNADVILVDDIHILKGRVFALEFMARLVDKVEGAGKILIMASRGSTNTFSMCPPFKTRVMSSLKVSLSTPSYEARRRIFGYFCLRLGINPSARIVDFVSKNISNPRAIIGAATRFKAYYDIYNLYPDYEKFVNMVDDLVDSNGIDPVRFFGKGKPGRYLYALFLKETGMKASEISETLGCSRATVYNYIKRATQVLKKDKKWAKKFNDMLNLFPKRSQP